MTCSMPHFRACALSVGASSVLRSSLAMTREAIGGSAEAIRDGFARGGKNNASPTDLVRGRVRLTGEKSYSYQQRCVVSTKIRFGSFGSSPDESGLFQACIVRLGYHEIQWPLALVVFIWYREVLSVDHAK